jgi:hypothetical protein
MPARHALLLLFALMLPACGRAPEPAASADPASTQFPYVAEAAAEMPPHAAPPDTLVPQGDANEEMVPLMPSAPQLDPAAVSLLETHGWTARTGGGRAVWVSIPRQMFHILEGSTLIMAVPCATAANGPGSEMGSFKTPLGWHRISEKFGEGAPWGQVFRSRVPTQEIWRPGDNMTEDLVLTRVLWLDGEEPGLNKGVNTAGVNVDSKERCIYIHGTNAETQIGTPSSHGCIRLLNDDVITAFELLPLGTPVLISDEAAASPALS